MKWRSMRSHTSKSAITPSLSGRIALDVVGRAANHAFGIVADGKCFAIVDIHRNHRRFIENDAFATYVDQGVGGAKVDRHVSAYEPCNAIEKLAHQSDRLMDDSGRTPSLRASAGSRLGTLCQDMPLL